MELTRFESLMYRTIRDNEDTDLTLRDLEGLDGKEWKSVLSTFNKLKKAGLVNGSPTKGNYLSTNEGVEFTEKKCQTERKPAQNKVESPKVTSGDDIPRGRALFMRFDDGEWIHSNTVRPSQVPEPEKVFVNKELTESQKKWLKRFEGKIQVV